MKNYLPYGGTIKSKDLMEAISIPNGIGPICGFGSIDKEVFTSSTKTVKLKQDPFDGDTINALIKDNNMYHGVNIIDAPNTDTKLISNQSIGAKPVTFACITHDGYEYATNNDTINVPVINERGSYNEVIIFAYHDVLEVNIENPVYFKAFWNRGSKSFYDFYTNTYLYKTLNQFGKYEPATTYEDLVNMAMGSKGQGDIDDGGVLIGVYGLVPNTSNDSNDYFSIVPYGGKVQPANLDRNIINYLDSFISKLKSFLGEYPSNTLSIKDYIDANANNGGTGEPVIGVPIGGIIIWTDPNNIPDGFVICNGTKGTPDLSGRFVYGYGAKDSGGNTLQVGATGGNTTTRLNIDQIPAHSHHIFRKYYKGGDNNHYIYQADWEKYATNENHQETDPGYNDDGCPTGKTGKEVPDPINILPPYTVLIYIMRVS